MLIVGLGNPGSQYENTKHNIGWLQLEKFSKNAKLNFSLDKKHKASIARGNYKGKMLTLAMPLTYMNLSGESVISLVNYYKYSIDDILVVYDEKDFDFGVIKIRKDGSSAGHNGIKSIISHLGTEKFPRLRMGIGPKPKEYEMANFVLSNFSSEEKKKLEDDILIKGCQIIDSIIIEGLEKAMNIHNSKKV